MRGLKILQEVPVYSTLYDRFGYRFMIAIAIELLFLPIILIVLKAVPNVCNLIVKIDIICVVICTLTGIILSFFTDKKHIRKKQYIVRFEDDIDLKEFFSRYDIIEKASNVYLIEEMYRYEKQEAN